MIRSLSLIGAVVAGALAFALPAQADDCAITVGSNDAMQFDTKEITVPASCKSFTVTLSHNGKLPKASMGHNWVLTTTADMQTVANEGMAAGAAADYLKADDPRVIAHTKMLGGGESDTISFDVSKLSAGTDYTFFCSFPGHWAIMKGTLSVK